MLALCEVTVSQERGFGSNHLVFLKARPQHATLVAYKGCNVACHKHSPCLYKLRELVTSYLVTLTSHITSTGLQALGYKGGLQAL